MRASRIGLALTAAAALLVLAGCGSTPGPTPCTIHVVEYWNLAGDDVEVTLNGQLVETIGTSGIARIREGSGAGKAAFPWVVLGIRVRDGERMAEATVKASDEPGTIRITIGEASEVPLPVPVDCPE